MNEDFSATSDFTIFPNPSTQDIFLQFTDVNAVSNVEVYNTAGQLVQEYQIEDQSNILKMTLKGGTYLIKLVKRDGGVETERVVISP